MLSEQVDDRMVLTGPAFPPSICNISVDINGNKRHEYPFSDHDGWPLVNISVLSSG